MSDDKNPLGSLIVKSLGEEGVVLDAITQSLKAASEAQKALTGSTREFSLLDFTSIGASLDAIDGQFVRMKQSINTLYTVATDSIKSTETLASSVQKLSILTRTDYEKASELASVYNALGVSTDALAEGLENAAKKGYEPSIKGIEKMRSEYQSLSSPMDRAKYLMETFGHAGGELQPILAANSSKLDELGRRAKTYGLVMSSDAVNTTKEYASTLRQLSSVVDGVKNQLGQAFIPILNNAGKAVLSVIDNFSAEQQVLKSMPVGQQVLTAATNLFTGSLTRQVESLQAAQRAAAVYQDSDRRYGEVVSAATKITDTSTQSFSNQNATLDLVNMSMTELTQQMLFNKAAEGMTGDAALELEKSMGLLNQKTYDTLTALQQLKEKYDTNHDGAIDAAEAAAGYTKAVTDLANGINGLQDKTVTVTEVHNVVTNTSSYPTGGGAVDFTHPTTTPPKTNSTPSHSGGGATDPTHSTRAFGGGIGPGETLVGEFGPEIVRLNAGSSGSVVNNYHTHYSFGPISANYQYQAERSLRNDINLMAMMRPR